MILAVSANSVTKIIVAFMTGGWPYARALGPGIILDARRVLRQCVAVTELPGVIASADA